MVNVCHLVLVQDSTQLLFCPAGWGQSVQLVVVFALVFDYSLKKNMWTSRNEVMESKD